MFNNYLFLSFLKRNFENYSKLMKLSRFVEAHTNKEFYIANNTFSDYSANNKYSYLHLFSNQQ